MSPASVLLRHGGSSLPLHIGAVPTNTRSSSLISFCRTGFLSIIRLRILSGLYKMAGCTHYFTFPYLKNNPVGYVNMGCFLLRCGVLFYKVRHYHFTETYALGTLLPFGISIGIGKEGVRFVRPAHGVFPLSSDSCLLPPAIHNREIWQSR